MSYIKKVLTKLIFVMPLLVSAAVIAESSDYNMSVGVTEVSKSIFELHMVIFWICVAIGVIVFSIMFWSLWKYRKSKGAVAADFDDNFWLEIGWTVAATLVLVWMAVPLFFRVLTRSALSYAGFLLPQLDQVLQLYHTVFHRELVLAAV